MNDSAVRGARVMNSEKLDALVQALLLFLATVIGSVLTFFGLKGSNRSNERRTRDDGVVTLTTAALHEFREEIANLRAENAGIRDSIDEHTLTISRLNKEAVEERRERLVLEGKLAEAELKLEREQLYNRDLSAKLANSEQRVTALQELLAERGIVPEA